MQGARIINARVNRMSEKKDNANTPISASLTLNLLSIHDIIEEFQKATVIIK